MCLLELQPCLITERAVFIDSFYHLVETRLLQFHRLQKHGDCQHKTCHFIRTLILNVAARFLLGWHTICRDDSLWGHLWTKSIMGIIGNYIAHCMGHTLYQMSPSEIIKTSWSHTMDTLSASLAFLKDIHLSVVSSSRKGWYCRTYFFLCFLCHQAVEKPLWLPVVPGDVSTLVWSHCSLNIPENRTMYRKVLHNYQLACYIFIFSF